MDKDTVREAARNHGQAVVAGDLKRAGADLTREAAATAPEVMGRMPRGLTACEVLEVRPEGAEWVAAIRYVGEGELVVESRWAERDGRPRITSLAVRSR